MQTIKIPEDSLTTQHKLHASWTNVDTLTVSHSKNHSHHRCSKMRKTLISLLISLSIQQLEQITVALCNQHNVLEGCHPVYFVCHWLSCQQH